MVPGRTKQYNLTKDEWSSMRKLAEDKNIVIKAADKGSNIVVWDRDDYLKEANNQLSDITKYRFCDFSERDLLKLVEKNNKLFLDLRKEGFVTEKDLKYFLFDNKNSSNLGKFYLLPKIHKRLVNVPGRPVISNCGTPTEKASEFLDHLLQPVMRSGKSYIKDTSHFLEKIKDLGEVPEDAILVTADVVGLYPSIPHNDGLAILEKQLDKVPQKKLPTSEIVKLAEFVLKNNFFEFNGDIVHQVSGTAIGTKFAPSYACIFMDFIENQFLEGESSQPWVWLRYIDDIFFVWTKGEKELIKFMERLNKFHTNLKFTFDWSPEKINFLDLSIKLKDKKFVTDLYCKPTDGHQYLHFESCHPAHIKNSIVYSQAMRLKRICSSKEDLNQHLDNLKVWFQERGYPDDLIDKQITQSLTGNNGTKNQESSQRVPFVLVYNPLLAALPNIIRQKAKILDENQEVSKVFCSKPFVSFRAPRNLKSHLVRAKLYPLERTVGSSKCNKKKCLTCDNIEETKTFKGKHSEKIYCINHKLTCDDKCLIYLLTCKICNLQYIGQTRDKFRYRWNNYKANYKKSKEGQNHFQREIFEHFKSEGHNDFLEDCSITHIDKTDSSDPL